MAGDEQQDEGPRVDEPVYEVIGAGRLYPEVVVDDDGVPLGPGAASLVLAHFLLQFARAVRSGRFWWQSATILLASLGVALLVLVVANGGVVPPDAAGGACIVTAAVLVVVSCVLALRWARDPGMMEAGREHPNSGPLLNWAVAGGRGAVFTVLAALFLVALAYATESSPAIAGVAAVLAFLEFLVFGAVGAVGAGTLWGFSKTTGRVVVWSAAFLLLVGMSLPLLRCFPPCGPLNASSWR